jgi:hypothetical protein
VVRPPADHNETGLETFVLLAASAELCGKRQSAADGACRGSDPTGSGDAGGALGAALEPITSTKGKQGSIERWPGLDAWGYLGPR